jgi:lipopolysaccharide export system permease protein
VTQLSAFDHQAAAERSLSRRLSPTVDRFLARSFLSPFFFTLAAFVGVHILANAIDRFQEVVIKGGAFGAAYLLLQVPLGIVLLLPPTCLTAVLLGFGLINRTGEVLAFQGLGISRLQMAIPVVMVAAGISVCDFAIGETVVPFAAARSHAILNRDLSKEAATWTTIMTSAIWIRQRGGFLSVDLFDVKKMRLSGVTFYHIDPNYGLLDIDYAKSAVWDGSEWKPSEVQSFRFSRNRAVAGRAGSEFRIEARPKDLMIMIHDPDEFSLRDLDLYIEDLRLKGLDPGPYLVDRDMRYAKPFSCLIMTALGVALSLDPVPRRSSLARGFAAGMGIGFLYFLAFGLTVSFGRSGLIPAFVAAWTPNALFALIAGGLFIYSEER